MIPTLTPAMDFAAQNSDAALLYAMATLIVMVLIIAGVAIWIMRQTDGE